MNAWLMLILIGIGGLCSSCNTEGDKIREEIEHIADTGEEAEL